MTDEHANEPWAHRSTPVARGFGAALDRLDAGSRGAATSQNDVGAQALLISGTDTNAAELAAYVKALTEVYIAEIANDKNPSDERAALFVRGLAMTTWLAGRLAAELGDGPASAGSTHAEPHVDQLRPLDSRPEDRRDALRRRQTEELRELKARFDAENPPSPADGLTVSLRLVLELERYRAHKLAFELRALELPLWELFDGVARELGDYLNGELGQHS